MFIDAIMYFCCFLSGLFFGVFFFTALENFSKGFRNFVRTVCNKIPYNVRAIAMGVVMLVTGVGGFLWLGWGITLTGLFCGAVSGIFMYFRAGVTLGNDPDPYNKKGKRRKKVKKLK